MPSTSSSATPPTQRTTGGYIVGGGREVGADIARKVGVMSPQQVIAGAIAQTPAASLARRITGQESGKEFNRVSRQLQRWAKGERGITSKGVNDLLADYPNARVQLPALGQVQAQLSGMARPPLALPPGATMWIRCIGTSEYQSGAGEPEERDNHGARFFVRNAQGNLTAREVDKALGDPVGYWLDKFQTPAPGIQYTQIDSLEIQVEY